MCAGPGMNAWPFPFADRSASEPRLPVFLALVFAYILSQFFRAFLAIVAGDLSRDIGLTAADLGAISAVWFIAFAMAQFPVGWALDRIGPRRTMAGLMVLAVAGALWLSTATTYAGCLASMALIGIGCSPILMGSLYVFARTYPIERFAMMSSFIIGFGSAGSLLGATPLALAVEAVGWRATMVGIAGVTALSALVLLAIVRDPPRLDQAGGSDSILGGLSEIAAIRSLWLLLPITATSYAVVIATRSLWIAPFFKDVHGFGATEIGHAALVMSIAMSLGALAFGPIERIVGSAKATTLVGCAITGALFVTLGFTGAGGALWSILLLTAIGAIGLSYGILMAHARLFFPAHLIGRGVTFMNFAFIAGAGVVQWLSGLSVQAMQEAGAAPGLVFGRLFLAFGLALLGACALYAFSPARPRPVP